MTEVRPRALLCTISLLILVLDFLYLTFRFSWAPHSTLQRGRQGGDSGAHLADGKSKKLGVLERHSGLLSTSTPKPQTSVPLTRGKSFHLGNALPVLGQARPGVQAVDYQGHKTGETESSLMLGLWAIGHGDTYL